MNVLEPGPEPREDRPASAILHDGRDARVVAFTLRARQAVAPHRSASTVLFHVLDGDGIFTGEDRQAHLAGGQTAACQPGEKHGITAGPSGLRFLAIIAPAPGG